MRHDLSAPPASHNCVPRSTGGKDLRCPVAAKTYSYRKAACRRAAHAGDGRRIHPPAHADSLLKVNSKSDARQHLLPGVFVFHSSRHRQPTFPGQLT